MTSIFRNDKPVMVAPMKPGEFYKKLGDVTCKEFNVTSVESFRPCTEDIVQHIYTHGHPVISREQALMMAPYAAAYGLNVLAIRMPKPRTGSSIEVIMRQYFDVLGLKLADSWKHFRWHSQPSDIGHLERQMEWVAWQFRQLQPIDLWQKLVLALDEVG